MGHLQLAQTILLANILSKKKKEIKEIIDCPECDGKIIEKKLAKEKYFMDVVIIQNVKIAYWDIPTGEKCPKCGAMLTIKKIKSNVPVVIMRRKHKNYAFLLKKYFLNAILLLKMGGLLWKKL